LTITIDHCGTRQVHQAIRLATDVKSWSATARRLSASLSAFNEFVVEALGVEGDDVIHASNGKEAPARCKRQAADMLATSNYPEIDGWQIAERCREHDPGLPAILRDRLLTVQAGPVAGSYPCRSRIIPRTSSKP